MEPIKINQPLEVIRHLDTFKKGGHNVNPHWIINFKVHWHKNTALAESRGYTRYSMEYHNGIFHKRWHMRELRDPSTLDKGAWVYYGLILPS